MKQTQVQMMEQPDESTADVVKRMSPEEADKLGGMLGAIAGKVLRVRGWYGYTRHETGEKVLILCA